MASTLGDDTTGEENESARTATAPTDGDDAAAVGRANASIRTMVHNEIRARRARGLRLTALPEPPQPTELFQVLELQARAKLNTLVHWLEELMQVDPNYGKPTAEAMHILRAAARGSPFALQDYTSELRRAQESWVLGGHASSKWRTWARGFPQESDLIQEIREGFSWQWLTTEERWEVREKLPDGYDKPHRFRMPTGELVKFISEGLRMGFIRRARADEKPFHNLVFSVPKTDGSLRWVLDMTKRNCLMRRVHMRMEGTFTMSQTMPRHAWVVTADWRKYYWVWKVCARDQPAQAFEGPDPSTAGVPPTHHSINRAVRSFVFEVVTMGGGQSAQRTSQPPKLMKRKLAHHGIGDGVIYMDEWALWQLQRAMACLAGLSMVVMGFLLGIPHSWEKLRWLPRQQFELLGLEWNTVRLERSLMRSRVAKVQEITAALQAALNPGGTVTIRFLCQFIGNLTASQEGARNAGYFAAALNESLAKHLRDHRGSYDALVTPGQTWAPAVRWVLQWTDWDLWAHMRLPPPRHQLTADASPWSAGAHTQSWNTGEYRATYPFNGAELGLHHNIQENKATRAAVVGFAEFSGLCRTIPDDDTPLTVINVESDNTMNIRLVNKHRSKSIIASTQTIAFADFTDVFRIAVTASFISGRTMDTHRHADSDSRAKSKWWDWALPTCRFELACQRLQLNPTTGVDLFAGPTFAHTRRKVTRRPSEGALWADALSRSWSPGANPSLQPTDWIWTFPPPALLPRIAATLTDREHLPVPQIVLIVPHHAGRSWWDLLRPHWNAEPIPMGPLNKCVPPESETWSRHHSRGKKDKRQTPPNWELCALSLTIDTTLIRL